MSSLLIAMRFLLLARRRDMQGVEELFHMGSGLQGGVKAEVELRDPLDPHHLPQAAAEERAGGREPLQGGLLGRRIPDEADEDLGMTKIGRDLRAEEPVFQAKARSKRTAFSCQ